jgi:hypothetical protein
MQVRTVLECALYSIKYGMFVRIRAKDFESSVNKVFHKEKLVNSKTIYIPI